MPQAIFGDAAATWGEPEGTLQAVLGQLADGAELVTLIAGAEAPVPLERLTGLKVASVEVHIQDVKTG